MATTWRPGGGAAPWLGVPLFRRDSRPPTPAEPTPWHRSGPTQTFEIIGTATVSISRPQREVWWFVESPEAALLLDDSIISATRMPGTPRGAGEIHASLHQTPNGLRGGFVRVLEYEYPRRAVLENLNQELEEMVDSIRTVVVVEPTGPAACTVSQSYVVQMRLPHLPDELRLRLEDLYRGPNQTFLERLRRVLETGVPAPVGAIEEPAPCPETR